MYWLKKSKELNRTIYYMDLAAKEAKKSTCVKSQRGVVVVKNDRIIGKGHNKVTFLQLCSPCIRENIVDNSRVELCSAIHAEQMALIGVDKELLKGARMYHIKLKNGDMRPSGKPSCTVCSRILYIAQIEFVLWRKEGYAVYQPEELNKLSFKYFLEK